MANKLKVLIVEDFEDLFEPIKYILSLHDYEARFAADGIKALKLLDEETDIGLIISDIDMPNLNGIGLLAEVKKSYDIPFVFMTGGSSLNKNSALKLGAVDFIEKPFTEKDLLQILKKIKAKQYRKSG